MEKELIFAFISIFFFFIGTIPYFRDVLQGKTTPHPFSYLIWAILTGFNAYVLVIHKEYISSIPAIINTVSCVILVFYGIRTFHTISIHFFDYFCLFLSFCLLPFYILTGEILATVIFSIVIDFMAYLPTIKKGWLQPWSETIFTFFVIGVVHLCMILAIRDADPQTLLFWVYAVLMDAVVFAILFFRRWYLKGWHSIFE